MYSPIEGLQKDFQIFSLLAWPSLVVARLLFIRIMVLRERRTDAIAVVAVHHNYDANYDGVLL